MAATRTSTSAKRDPLDHDGNGRKGGSKAPPVWVVTPGVGLHRVDSDAVDAVLADEKSRLADDKDLAVAGHIGANILDGRDGRSTDGDNTGTSEPIGSDATDL